MAAILDFVVISVILLTRNAPTLAGAALDALLASADALHAAAGDGVRFVIADDHSDERFDISQLLRKFKSQCERQGHAATCIVYREHQHYTHALARAMSLAISRSDGPILFVSHDMILTPPCVATLIELAADPTIGIIRPTSEHMDYARALTVAPPRPPRGFEDVAAFAGEMRQRAQGRAIDVPILIGDAMLVKRAVIERIGIYDTRFFGFMADIDYGIRSRRAGFGVVVAPGAWLHHEGNGAGKELAAAGGRSVEENGREMLAQARAAYELFRQKWNLELPADLRELRRAHFEALHALPPPTPADDYVPPIPFTPDVAAEV